MKKRGVSLIVLIVTIIVVIVLAAVVILTLSKNNPIESAKEAAFKEDVRTFQDELAMYISKDYTNKAGQRDSKITANKYVVDSESADYEKSVYKYIQSFSKKYEGKLIIINDELAYTEDNVTKEEKKWCDSLGIRTNEKTGAEKAKEDPQNYYGAKVKYTAPNGVNDWKIFYSDGSNVYLIASEYVSPQVENQLPSKGEGNRAVKPDQGDSTNYPKGARFNNILGKYSGSSNIVDEKMKAFNSEFFNNNYTSGYNNMRAVAYMLDKEIWSELYANSSVAEYAVGGPSLELAFKSYCEKYPEKKDLYIFKVLSEVGYQVSNNGGRLYTNYISNMLREENEELYTLSTNNGANAMWFATPSANHPNHIMNLSNNGDVSNCNYDRNNGFRPLVCLNSNISLNWNEQEKIFEIK